MEYILSLPLSYKIDSSQITLHLMLKVQCSMQLYNPRPFSAQTGFLIKKKFCSENKVQLIEMW